MREKILSTAMTNIKNKYPKYNDVIRAIVNNVSLLLLFIFSR